MNQRQTGKIKFCTGINPSKKLWLIGWKISLTVFFVLVLFCMQAYSFDISQIREASPELLNCLAERIGDKTLNSVLKGNPPKNKKTQKKLKKAYYRCAAMTSENIPKDITPYSGPLFDAISQIDETVDSKAAIIRVRKSGVTRLALFARSKRQLHQNEKMALKIAELHPNLITIGAPKYFQLSGDISQLFIKATVKGIQKYGYRFIGEILYSHADKKSGKQYPSGERYVDPLRTGTARLLEAIAPFKIPLMTHWEPYAPERDFPKFHALYDAWPNQVFIVPHMGFASPMQVDTFLTRHPNLYMIISKKERLMEDFKDPRKQASIGSAFLDGFRLKPEWKKILVQYQDRLLFGTDPHMKKLWDKYELTVKYHRLVLGQLPQEVAARIAHKNAEILYKTGPTPLP
ncbi:MAG: amidohydrolase family protein [Deltaproteobacteria bacterium]|nr:amidohydrolase family protein [Deltaproteobacteria bacterium]